MRDFKQLIVWQRAHAFSVAIHDAVRQFPRGQHAALRAQLVRAAQSIAANIVEGCGAASQREFSRYLDIGIKSSNETEYHLISARDLEALGVDVANDLTREVIEIRRMVYGLRKKVLADSRGDADGARGSRLSTRGSQLGLASKVPEPDESKH